MVNTKETVSLCVYCAHVLLNQEGMGNGLGLCLSSEIDGGRVHRETVADERNRRMFQILLCPCL